MTGSETAAAPAQDLTTAVVHQWQCDHFGHLNVRHYAALFDDAVFVFWHRHGQDSRNAIVPVTADMRIAFRSEVGVGAIVAIRSRVGRIGTKSVQVQFDMVDARSERPHATCEIVEVFFDRESRKSEPIPSAVRDSLMSASTLAGVKAEVQDRPRDN